MNKITDNQVVGVVRTNEDKRKAVETLLEDPEWSQWCDSEIAKHAGVSAPFVKKIREEKAK